MNTPPSPAPVRFALRVTVKALLLYLAINLALGLGFPSSQALGRLSVYNRLIPGRERLPYADNPSRAYSLTLFNLDAMFASHQIAAGPKPVSEYRVVLIGDSNTWGYLLRPDETLAAALNRLGLQAPGGRAVRFYNLAYPVMSLAKDLVLLQYALRNEPDLVVWPVTLESFPYDKQLASPLLQKNPQAVRDLIATYHLRLDPQDPQLKQPGFWEQTLVGQRRDLADLLRLQVYGVLWAATGIDQDIPAQYTPRQEDLSADLQFHDLEPPHLTMNDLGFDLLDAAHRMAGQTPVLLVNEPVLISRGRNSDLRYNFYYPRWAYDDYRQLMQAKSVARGWRYVDFWDLVPNEEFTNTAVHLSPRGTELLAQAIGREVEALLRGGR